MIIPRVKCFTKWDETDRLKAMKDSDILAEKKRSTRGDTVRNMATGAVGGALIGTGVGAVGGLASGRGFGGRIASAGRMGKNTAILGAAIGAGVGYMRNRKQAEENKFYNQRLQYAQNQAMRRERKDWKTNMTQRDGYSY